MTDLLKHMLATYALWFAFAQGKIPIWGDLRDKMMLKWPIFGTFALCAMCSGFWCSLAIAALDVPSDIKSLVYMLTKGLAGAAACYIIEAHVTKLEGR